MTSRGAQRCSWDEYFLNIARLVASRSTCIRRQVGAVAVNARHRIIGTGYNGAPPDYPHCTYDTCIRHVKNIPSGEAPHLCVALHAEANIVLQLGERLAGGTLYCTTQPCSACLKLLMGCKIHRVVWMESYPDMLSEHMAAKYGVTSKFVVTLDGERHTCTELRKDDPPSAVDSRPGGMAVDD